MVAMRPDLPEQDHGDVLKFRPSSGTVAGYTGIVLMIVLAVYLVSADPGRGSVQVALGLGALAVLFWVSLVRPRAEVVDGVLVIRNMVRDVHVPLAAIDLVDVRHTLDVWVDDRRFTCIGIGYPLTESRKKAGRTGNTSTQRHGGGYPGMVASRIEQLAQAARYDAGTGAAEVRHTWAWPEIALFALLLGGLVATSLG
jgi:hypothetical protein